MLIKEHVNKINYKKKYHKNIKHAYCLNFIFILGNLSKIFRKQLLASVFTIGIFILNTNISNAQKVTINKTNTPLQEVMSSITNQTGYDFFFSKELIKKAHLVTIYVTNKPLENVLETIFASQPISFSVTNRTIVLRARDASATNADNNSKSLGLVLGHVTDLAGSPLVGISIKYKNVKGDDIIMYSDSHGTFQVPVELGNKLVFFATGYITKEIVYNGENDFSISLTENGAALPDVQISSIAQYKKKDPTLSVDLTMRSYMNLSQVLQGTIPGLSLQIVNSTKKIITDVYARQNANGGFRHYSVEQFLQAYGASDGQRILDALLAGQTTLTGYNLKLFNIRTQTSTTSSLVPQLRGANNFSSNVTGMLVVIDGFPKDEFPADYPMANVESVEVIKDPKELIKWGPKANGGIIMVKTKSPKKGSLTMNYNANFYYSPNPKYDRKKMQLAKSPEILDYMKDLLDSNLIPNSYGNNPLDLNPAQLVLYKKMNNIITENAFNQSWDSLKSLDNESQLNQLMQNVFNQNHTISVFGSVPHYSFSAIGTYNSNKSNSLGNYSRKFGLNLNNDLKLLNDKLKIQLYLNLSRGRSQAGTTFDPNSKFQPYQMLLDNDGNYVYDYPSLSQDVNSLIMGKGYYNYGVNQLEDARNTSSKSNQFQTQARLNMEYNPLAGLQWSSSVYYTNNSTKNFNFSGKNSSTVRRLVDTYGEYNANGINFYVPYGDIMSISKQSESQLNVRSAISYSKILGKHRISASIGGGGYLYSLRLPSHNTMYGYNPNTGTGTPIYLPSSNPNGAVTNFTSLISGNSSSVYPYQLLTPIQGDSTNNRNLNMNASLGYSFNSRIFLSGNYTNVYNPNYGQVPTYSTLSTLSFSGSYRIIQNTVENWFNKLDLTTSYSQTKMPDLPTSYSNIRYSQSAWGNYAIWVNGYSPSQQGGQKSEKISETLTSQFLKGHVELNLAINRQKISNMSNENSLGQVTRDSSSTKDYLSTGAIVNFRKNLLRFNLNYNKSPEGNSQINGDFSYDIAKESYFKSKFISSLIADMRIEDISPMQGLGLMMETNRVQASGNFSYANNGDFNSMPPKNTNFEVHTKLGIVKDKYFLDLRYYNHSTSGVSSYVPLATDPSTGLSSQYSYSLIKNKGVEFYLQGEMVRTRKFSYVITLNGAYNVNVAKSVPTTNFTMSTNYTTAYRNGYNTASLWSYRWAGLDNKGNPQIYDNNNNIVSNPDSATLANSLVYSGVTRAPWTGGFIQEFNVFNFFSRIALNFNLGYIMRRYLPSPSSDVDKSELIKDRWRKPGDELTTDIAAISSNGLGGTVRSYIIKNSTNSIVSADNVRLQEIMIGWRAPQNFLNNKVVRSLIVTLQVQNAALWTKNKWHVDPSVVGATGEIGMPNPVIYSGTVNLSF